MEKSAAQPGKKYKIDQTKGSIAKHLFKYSLPLIASSLLQNLYNIADTICVGQMIGDVGLASVGNCFSIVMLVISIFLGLSMGIVVLIGQYAGANDKENLAKVFSTGNALFLIIGIIMTVLSTLLASPILTLINTDAEVFPHALPYLQIMFSGTIFTALYNLGSAYMRGLGDSKTPLIFVLITTALNIPLDILFIGGGFGFIPAMGTAGAALATVVSQAVSVSLCIVYLSKRQKKMGIKMLSIKIDVPIMKRMFKLGLFMAIQQALVSLSFTVMVGMINLFDPLYASAYGAGSRVDALIILPAQAIQQGVAAVAAQNIGANLYDRARETLKWGIIYVVIINAVLSVLILAFGEYAIMLFIDDPAIIAEGYRYLRYMSIYFVPIGVMFVTNGLLQGAGDSKAPMLFTLISAYAVRLPLAYILMGSLQVTGVYIAMVVGPIFTAIVALIYYKIGRWTKMRVADKVY